MSVCYCLSSWLKNGMVASSFNLGLKTQKHIWMEGVPKTTILFNYTVILLQQTIIKLKHHH